MIELISDYNIYEVAFVVSALYFVVIWNYKR